MKRGEKLYSISFLRVVSMLLIVLYHSFCYSAGSWFFADSAQINYGLWFPVSVFSGLNLFVFIAGYLYGYLLLAKGKYTKFWPFILNKTRRLLMPYLIWNVLIVLLLPFNPSIKEFLMIVLKKGYIHLWFLLMLFKIFLIITVTKPLWMRTRFWHDICIIAALFLFHTTHLPLTGSLPDLAIFYSGIIVTRHRERLPQNVHVGLLLLLFFIYVFSFTVDYSLFKYIIFLLFAFSLLKKIDDLFERFSLKKTNKFIEYLDGYSMGVYILHHIIIFQILFYIPLSHVILNVYPIMGPILFFVFILTMSLCLCWLIDNIRFSRILFG